MVFSAAVVRCAVLCLLLSTDPDTYTYFSAIVLPAICYTYEYIQYISISIW